MNRVIFILIIGIVFIILLILLCKIKRDRNNVGSIHMENWIGRRNIQEDSSELLNLSKHEILAIIADGMGGYHDGRLASQFSVDRFIDLYMKSQLSVIDIISEINQEILNYSSGIGIKDNIGTTFLAGEILYNRLLYFSVGDSSLFLFRKNKLERLNKHQEKKGYLTNYLGYCDFNEIDTKEITLEERDIILMCSDGLDKVLSYEEISNILKKYKNKSSEKIIIKLLDNLKKKSLNKQDNVSIIVIK